MSYLKNSSPLDDPSVVIITVSVLSKFCQQLRHDATCQDLSFGAHTLVVELALFQVALLDQLCFSAPPSLVAGYGMPFRRGPGSRRGLRSS